MQLKATLKKRRLQSPMGGMWLSKETPLTQAVNRLIIRAATVTLMRIIVTLIIRLDTRVGTLVADIVKLTVVVKETVAIIKNTTAIKRIIPMGVAHQTRLIPVNTISRNITTYSLRVASIGLLPNAPSFSRIICLWIHTKSLIARKRGLRTNRIMAAVVLAVLQAVVLAVLQAVLHEVVHVVPPLPRGAPRMDGLATSSPKRSERRSVSIFIISYFSFSQSVTDRFTPLSHLTVVLSGFQIGSFIHTFLCKAYMISK